MYTAVAIRLRNQIDKAKRNGRKLSYEDAYEEVVADSCETFLRDSGLFDKLLRLAEKDMSLFEKTKKYISELFDRVAGLKKEYNAFRPDSIESEIVNGMTDTIKQLHKLWEDAAIAALENSREAATAQKENGLPRGEATRNDNSKNNSGTKQKNTTSEGDVKMQARELDSNGKAYWQIESEKDIFKGIKNSKALKNAAYNYILRGDKGNKIVGLIDGQNLDFIRVSANEYVYGKQSQTLSEEAYKQKMRMSTSIIDLIDNADVTYDAPDHKNHKLFPNGFKNYQGRVGIDDTIFRYIVRVGKAKNGMIFYDINLEVDGEVPRANRTSLLKKSTSNGSISNSSENVNNNSLRDPAFISDRKQRQFEIIQKTNPMWDSYHTGIRTVADIRTWDEVLKLDDEREGQFVWGDYSRADAERALTDGEITVYSSYPIKNGVFVSTSYIQAQEYAGGKNAKVYSKTVPLTDVAWINGDEGQYAKVPESEISQSKGDLKMSIREEFYVEFDKWVADGRKDTNIRFVVGTTSDVLKSIGMKDHEIILPSGTINQKLKKHTELTTDIFRNIPALLEHPVIIQFSDAIDPKTHKPKYDSRITLLGELYVDMFINGKTIKKPVLVSMELLPTNQNKSSVLDFSVIKSAYAKNALQHYLQENSILYIDPNKKRTNKWLSLNRLQLPLGETKYGSIRKITYSGNKVKIQNSNNKTAMEIALEKAGVVDEFGNTKNSDRDPAFISDRKLLADALMSTAQNDGEYKMLTDYKKQIKKMYVEQQTLDDLNRQIKEISFKKGKKDYERLRTLRDEAIKTANRINLYDKRLLRIEAAAPLRAVLRREKAKAVSEQKKADAQQLKQYFTTRKGGFS